MQKLTLNTASRGTIIQDEYDNEVYLIFEHCKKKKTIRCLNRKFNEVSIGTDWIDHYYIYDTIDMDSFVKRFCKNGQLSMIRKHNKRTNK